MDSDDQLLRETFDALPLMAGAMVGPEYRLMVANAAFHSFYPQAAVGKTVDEFAPDARRQGITDMFDRVYQTGETVSLSEFRAHVDLQGAGLQEVYLNGTIVAKRRSSGDIDGLVFIATDVTTLVHARLAAEERARQFAGRYESIRDSATLMQQALLPAGVPVLPGAEIAAAYLVAADDTAAGGDWFDALTDPDGRLVLVLGDVVGHGVEAAAVMAQLRTAVRMQLNAGDSIADALEMVDSFATEIVGAKSATLCVARLDTATGEFEYCTAGHPPPLVITADGSPRYLKPTGAGPLGTGRGFATGWATLATGDVVMLYSDGIIERPGREPRASSAEVADVTARVLNGEAFPLAAEQSAIQRVCSQAVERLIRTTGYSDDITLLATQRRQPPSPMHAVVHGDEHAERTVRASLRSWLGDLGADLTAVQILEVVVSESVANSVEHGYADMVPGDVVVDASLAADGKVRVSITDRGTWKSSRTAHTNRGRGLWIAQALVTDTTVDHNGGGTTVTASYHLTRPAHIVTDPHIAAGATARPPAIFEVGVDRQGSVIVTGDLDTIAAPALASLLSSHSRGGTRALHVDLSAVTHLGSAAVSVLTDACERASRQGTECVLVAVPGGTAHHVLSLVGLPTVNGKVVE